MATLELTDRQEQCLRLWWGEDHPTQAEVARKMGISQPRVCMLIRKGTRRLVCGGHGKEIPTDPFILDQLDPRQIRAVV